MAFAMRTWFNNSGICGVS